MVPFVFTDNIITLVLNNTPYTINPDHINYDHILHELKYDQNEEVLLELVNVQQSLEQYFEETLLDIDLEAGIIKFQGNEVNTSLSRRILDMYKNGFNVQPMINFMTNLYQNPSQQAIDELYTFLEYGKLPITEDGHFLAYKRVNNDYTSIFDNRTDNSIGATVSMPRDLVDNRSHRTCSTGLHLCSHEYLPSYAAGTKVVILKVDPKDIVSIPSDYNNTKARACKYVVVGELNKPQTEQVDKNEPILNAVVDDEQNYKPEKPKEPEKSVLFNAAYTFGYTAGRRRDQFITSKLRKNDYVAIKDNNMFSLTESQANDINTGYDLGYKHGRNHKSRAFPKKRFDELTSSEL